MRFWIDRHGCAKNDVDGEEIAARLEAAGHGFAEAPPRPTSSLSTPAASSRTPRRSPSRPSWPSRPPIPASESSSPAAWPSATQPNSPPTSPRPTASSATPTSLGPRRGRGDPLGRAPRHRARGRSLHRDGQERAALRLPRHGPCQGDRRLLQLLLLLRHPPDPRTPSLPRRSPKSSPNASTSSPRVSGSSSSSARTSAPTAATRRRFTPTRAARAASPPRRAISASALSTSTPTTFPRGSCRSWPPTRGWCPTSTCPSSTPPRGSSRR